MAKDGSFSQQVADSLGHYVYRIIDPRNGLTFYVGKGQKDRIFTHEKDAKKEIEYLFAERCKELTTEQAEDHDRVAGIREEVESLVTMKHRTLNAIRNKELEPVYIIHRHGMDEQTAFEVEAALIDICPGLTNEKGGRHSGDRGPASISEVISSYARPVMDDPKDNNHKVLALNVSQTVDYSDPYTAARLAWRINLDFATQADCIFAMKHNVCMGVLRATEWKPATKENFPDLLDQDKSHCKGFDGGAADKEFRALYEGKQLPKHLKRKQGEAIPFRYLGAWPHKA